MKSNVKSSITLPAPELRLVNHLVRRLRAKSKVAVVRRALQLLSETTDRADLRRAYHAASSATRSSLKDELQELDHLSCEGLEE